VSESLSQPSASLASKFQDFPGSCIRFTGLSRTKLIFRTFQVLENIQAQFQDFPGSTGTLNFTDSGRQLSKTGTANRPFADLSDFGLELISLEEDEKHCLVHVSTLHAITPTVCGDIK